MSSLLKSYAFSVAAAAVAVTVALPGLRADDLPVLAALAVLSLVVGAHSVRFEGLRVEITAGDVFTFAALGLAAPAGVPVVAVAGVLGAALRRRRLTVRTFVNLTTLTLSGACAAWAHLLSIRAGMGSELAVLVGAGCFFLVNTIVISEAIHIHGGEPVLKVWLRSGAWTVTSTLAGALVALGLQTVLPELGPAGLILGLAGSATIAGSYKVHRARLYRELGIIDDLRLQLEGSAGETLAAEPAAVAPDPSARRQEPPVRAGEAGLGRPPD